MNDLYTKKYLENLLLTIDDNIKELEKWSIYNQNAFLEEIQNLHTFYNVLSQLLETFELKGGEENE